MRQPPPGLRSHDPAVLWPIALGSAMALAAVACGAAGSTTGAPVTLPRPTVAPPTAAPTTVVPTTVAPTTVAPTTVSPSAAYVPSAPQTSAAGAAAALVGDWERGDRVGAATVASPAASAAMFATGGRALQFRGCTNGILPETCTYADRSNAAGALYEINTSQTPTGGWYVTSVQIEQ